MKLKIDKQIDEIMNDQARQKAGVDDKEMPI
jgi:hypothetical protein